MTRRQFSDIITFTRASGALRVAPDGSYVGIDFSSSPIGVSVGTPTVTPGTYSFTLDYPTGIDRYWSEGDRVNIQIISGGSYSLTGTVTLYDKVNQQLVVNVTSVAGSGDSNPATWRISSLMPRLDHDPETLQPKGLLIEEQRTNRIRNNTMQGAVVGTPGTLPNNWGTSVNTGLTRQIVGVGYENGIKYIDMRLFGTSQGTSLAVNINLESVTNTAALANELWTLSGWLKIVGGSLNGISYARWAIGMYNSSLTLVGSYLVGGNITVTNTFTRSSYSATTSEASTAYVLPMLWIGQTTGANIDITLRIGFPQFENNEKLINIISATVVNGGSNYTNNDIVEVNSTGGTKARLTVTTNASGNVVSAIMNSTGTYSASQLLTTGWPNAVSVTNYSGSGAGSGATFNVTPRTGTGFISSVIPTTSAAVTRSQDSATVSIDSLSTWHNLTEGTLFVQGLTNSSKFTDDASYLATISGDTASANNYLGIYYAVGYTSINRMNSIIVANSVNNSNLVEPTNTTPNRLTLKKAALSYKKDNVVFATSDTTTGVGTMRSTVDTSSNVLPFATSLILGSGYTVGNRMLNGWVQKVIFYPYLLSNTTLQTITTL